VSAVRSPKEAQDAAREAAKLVKPGAACGIALVKCRTDWRLIIAVLRRLDLHHHERIGLLGGAISDRERLRPRGKLRKMFDQFCWHAHAAELIRLLLAGGCAG
jgi:hypothetical protein